MSTYAYTLTSSQISSRNKGIRDITTPLVGGETAATGLDCQLPASRSLSLHSGIMNVRRASRELCWPLLLSAGFALAGAALLQAFLVAHSGLSVQVGRGDLAEMAFKPVHIQAKWRAPGGPGDQLPLSTLRGPGSTWHTALRKVFPTREPSLKRWPGSTLSQGIPL